MTDATDIKRRTVELKAGLLRLLARHGLLGKQARWPAGSTGGKGGEFAPKGAGGGGGAYAVTPPPFKPMSGKKFTVVPQHKIVPASGTPKFPGWGGAPMAHEKPKVMPQKAPSHGAPHADAPPKPPKVYPDAAPHPKAGPDGKPFVIKEPDKATGAETWHDPKAVASFVPGGDVPGVLNGVRMEPWRDHPTTIEGWSKVAGQNHSIAEKPLRRVRDKVAGSGVIVQEPDGRVWLTSPSNRYGGYRNTFPKGTAEDGLSLQANAIKEAFEETGLQVEITGHFGDFERTTSVARFYLARRVGGSPADMGWESQRVKLVPLSELHTHLNADVDRSIAEHAQFFLPPGGTLKKSAGVLVLSIRARLAKIAAEIAKEQKRWPKGSPNGLGGQWMPQDGHAGPIGTSKTGKVMNISRPFVGKLLTGKNEKNSALVSANKMIGQYEKLANAGDVKALQAITEKMGPAPLGNPYTKGKWKEAHNALAYAQAKAAGLAPSAIGTRASGKLTFNESTWKKVGGQKGSNSGGLYEAPDGKTWYVKFSKSNDHARNEILGAKLASAAGGDTLDYHVIDLGNGKIGTATEWQKKELFDPSNPTHQKMAYHNFGPAAWTGNYDVVGTGTGEALNQALIGGKMVTVDTGGSLVFRAQGLPKGAMFGDTVGEFDTLRSGQFNPLNKQVFGGMTHSDIQDSIAGVRNLSDDQIRSIVKAHAPNGIGDLSADALANRMIARRDSLVQQADAMVPKAPAAVAPKIEAPEPVKAPAAATGTMPKLPMKSPGDTTWGKLYNSTIDELAAAYPKGVAAIQAVDIGVVPIGSKSHTSLLNWKHDAIAAHKAQAELAVPAAVAPAAAVTPSALDYASGAPAKPGNLIAGSAKSKAAAEMHAKIVAGDAAGLAAIDHMGSPSLKQFQQNGLNHIAWVKAKAAAGAPTPKAPVAPTAASVAEATSVAAPASLPPKPDFGGDKWWDSAATKLESWAKAGDTAKLKNALGVYGDTGKERKAKAYAQSLIDHLEGKSALATEEINSLFPPGPTHAASQPALPALPPKPVITSAANLKENKKLDQIEALALKGDAAGILALQYGTNTYAGHHVKYANDALASLGYAPTIKKGHNGKNDPLAGQHALGEKAGGAPADHVQAPEPAPAPTAPSPAPPPKAEKKPFVLDATKLEKPPVFLTSKVQIKAENEGHAAALYDMATKGDLAGLKAYDKFSPQSEKLVNYKAALIDEIDNQMNPPKKVRFNGTAGTEIGAHMIAVGKDVPTVPYENFIAHADKAADYLVVSKGGGAKLPVADAGVFEEKTAAQLAGFKAASDAGYSKLSSQEKSALKSYTGNAYGAWNDALRTGAIGSSSFKSAQVMVKAFNKAAAFLPEGTILWRGIGVSGATYEKHVGDILQDGSFQSASYGGHAAFSSKPSQLRLHIGPGVKGMMATTFSHYGTGESEIILAPNVKYVVMGTKKAGSKTIVDIMVLPHDA